MSARILSTRTAVTALSVTVVTLVVLAAALGWLVHLRSVDEATARARAELRSSAGTVVAQVFSVNQSTWQTDRARARELVGGEFAIRHATELTRAPDNGIRSIAWTPDAVGVIDAAGDHGDVLVRATVRTTPAAGAPDVERRSVTARFDRAGDHWVLSELEVVQ